MWTLATALYNTTSETAAAKCKGFSLILEGVCNLLHLILGSNHPTHFSVLHLLRYRLHAHVSGIYFGNSTFPNSRKRFCCYGKLSDNFSSNLLIWHLCLFSLSEFGNNSNSRLQSVRESLGHCCYWLVLLYRILCMAGDWINLHHRFHRWDERYVFFCFFHDFITIPWGLVCVFCVLCACACVWKQRWFFCCLQDVHWKKRLRYLMKTNRNSNSNMLRLEVGQSRLRYHIVERSLCIQARTWIDVKTKHIKKRSFF